MARLLRVLNCDNCDTECGVLSNHTQYNEFLGMHVPRIEIIVRDQPNKPPKRTIVTDLVICDSCLEADVNPFDVLDTTIERIKKGDGA